MKLEEQLVNLQLSRELHDLGVKCESYFEHRYLVFEDKSKEWRIDKITVSDFYVKKRYQAYSVAELGEMLPPQTGLYKSKNYYSCVDTNPHRINKSPAIKEETEANARAKMLIYLIKNNLIKVEDL